MGLESAFFVRFYKFAALAGIRFVLSRLGDGNRRRTVRNMVMEWWTKFAFPIIRVWCSVSSRFKPRKNGGLLKLHDDVQTCGYEDVQTMWEMLQRSDGVPVPSKHSNWFSRRFGWTNNVKSLPEPEQNLRRSFT